MGLAGRKEKQRIGLDPRNLTWSDDKSRFSYKHMTALGWTDKSGLGTELSGNPNHIAVMRKSDNGGIGMDRAKKEGNDVAANAGQAGRGLEDVLRRLAGGSASPSPAPSPGPGATAEEEKKEAEQKMVRNRIASRQRHLNAKRMASQSPAALAEILGVPLSSLPSSPSPAASPAATPVPEAQPEASSSSGTSNANERNSDETVKTATLSVSDYFRQKMREKMLARQTAAAARGETVKVDDLPSSSLERMAESVKKPIGGTSWEGTKTQFEEPAVPVEFDPSDRPVTPPPDEKAAKKAKKEAKRLAKLKADDSSAAVTSTSTSPAPDHDPIHEAAEAVHTFEHIGDQAESDKARRKREKEEKKAKKEAKKDKKRKRDDEEGDDAEPAKEKKEKRDKKDKVKKDKSKKDKTDNGA
ncbi:hypothetical protein IAU60_003111 [Kwoniella sp. DSM 27419]